MYDRVIYWIRWWKLPHQCIEHFKFCFWVNQFMLLLPFIDQYRSSHMLGNLYSFCSVTITKSEESTNFSGTTPVMILSIAPTLVGKLFRPPLQIKQAFLRRNLCYGCLLCISHHNLSQWHFCKVWFVSISIGFLTLRFSIPCLLNHPKTSFLIHMLIFFLEKKLKTNMLQAPYGEDCDCNLKAKCMRHHI